MDMTKLLEQAVIKARELSEAEQDAIGQLVPEEIEAERHWDQRFSNSPDRLSKFAGRAWAEHEAGKSQELDPDKL